MENLSIGEVVLATFPFSNLESTKVRPCLVVGIAEFDDLALCQITSKRYHSKTALSFTNSDLASGSIITNSFIRPDKIATLDKAMIRRKLGRLTDSKLSEVKIRLKSFLEIS